MNLNKYQKEAFVRAIIQDVPIVDYDAQALAIVKEWEKSTVPPLVWEVIKKHPDWIETSCVYLPGSLQNVSIFTTGNGWVIETQAPEVWEKLEEIAEMKSVQDNKIKELTASLTAVIDTCRTVKQARARLPEFDKYLPSEVEPIKDLPVANVVAELTAAGWPKGGAL